MKVHLERVYGILAVAFFVCLTHASVASAQTYYCTLTDALSLSDEGKLEPHPLRDQILKYQITVETQTGKVFHPEFGTSSYGFITVLDYGSKISSFKVIAYSEEGSRPDEGVGHFRNAAYFEIKTYAEGVVKPFMAQTGSSFGYGVCQ
jgi:hypothetical protein